MGLGDGGWGGVGGGITQQSLRLLFWGKRLCHVFIGVPLTSAGQMLNSALTKSIKLMQTTKLEILH